MKDDFNSIIRVTSGDTPQARAMNGQFVTLEKLYQAFKERFLDDTKKTHLEAFSNAVKAEALFGFPLTENQCDCLYCQEKRAEEAGAEALFAADPEGYDGTVESLMDEIIEFVLEEN